MKAIGKILEIIGSRHILIESDEDLQPEEILCVFSCITVPELEEKYNFKEIKYPKGEIEVVAHQYGKYFLCEIFRETTTKEKVVPGGLMSLNSLFGEKIVREQVKGDPSAELSKSTLDIKFNEKVEPGDYVGRL